MTLADQDIWDKIRSGHVDSLRILHDRYYSSLCNFASKTIVNNAVAEELVSSCFMRLWEQRGIIDVQHSIRSYLYFMVRNQLIDYIRSQKKDPLKVTTELPDIPTEDELNEQEFYADLYRAIEQLPEQRRRILEMAAFESLSYKEIAAKLDISVNTVKTQMGRAYQFLKNQLEPQKFSVFWLLYSDK